METVFPVELVREEKSYSAVNGTLKRSLADAARLAWPQSGVPQKVTLGVVLDERMGQRCDEEREVKRITCISYVSPRIRSRVNPQPIFRCRFSRYKPLQIFCIIVPLVMFTLFSGFRLMRRERRLQPFFSGFSSEHCKQHAPR